MQLFFCFFWCTWRKFSFLSRNGAFVVVFYEKDFMFTIIRYLYICDINYQFSSYLSINHRKGEFFMQKIHQLYQSYLKEKEMLLTPELENLASCRSLTDYLKEKLDAASYETAEELFSIAINAVEESGFIHGAKYLFALGTELAGKETE